MLAACALACLALGAGQASARSRQLQQNPPITDFYPEVVEKPESLTTACSIDKWETLLQQGENCVLSAAVVGKFEELQYTFELTADMAKRLSMQIVFEPFEGLAELGIFKLNGNGKKGAQVKRRSEAVREYDSGNSFIFLPELSPGKHIIAVTSRVTYSSFNLRIDMFPGDVALSETSEALLRAVKDDCCGTGAAACAGILADIDDPQAKPHICRDSVGNHCDTQGVLTHVDLSRSNMKCELHEVLSPLVAMSNGLIRSFEINGNDISGSLDDHRLLGEIEKWAGLRFLELGNLPKLTGNIPAGCPAPFNNLEHLGLSYTGVGGPLPECLINSVHQLELTNTDVHGPLPPLRADNNLRYILADQVEGRKPTFTGALPDLSGLQRLHYISFNGQGFTGTAKLPPNLQGARLHGNALTGVQAPLNLARLAYVDVSNNKLTGPVPEAFGRAGNMLTLNVAGNAYTSLPSQWVAGVSTATRESARLHHLDASKNKLQGSIPAIYGTMRYLRTLRLSDNELTGDIGEFTEGIPKASVLSVLQLQRNDLEGVLFFPALARLAVFSSRRWDKLADKVDPHVFDVSGNGRLEGEIDTALLTEYTAQLEANVDVRVDLRGTQVRCGREAQAAVGLTDEQLAALGCGGGGGGPTAARVALITFLVLVALVVLAVGVLVVRKRRAGGGGGGGFSVRNVPGAASEYVSEAELGGATTGTLSGRPSSRTYSSHLGEKPQSGAFGFMPQFLKDGTGPMAGLLSKQYSDVTAQQSSATAYVGSAGGDGGLGTYKAPRNGEAPLPVSVSRQSSSGGGGGGVDRERRHSRRSKSGRSAAAGGVAERVMEMSPPMSSVEVSDSPPPSRRMKGGKRPGARTLGLTTTDHTDEDDTERGMNITFNAAYDGGQS